MKINSDINKKLFDYKIPYGDGVLYLLSVYYDLKESFIPDILKKKVHASNIFEYNSKEGVIWRIPLFEDMSTHFDWVKDFRILFATKNRERAGDLSACTKRMKKYFSTNPDVRKDEVMEAAELYLKNCEAQFVMKSHNFIYDDKEISELSNWIEQVREIRENEEKRFTYNTKMRE